MDYIESGFNALGELVKNNISNTFIASALADGIIAGVGAVILFLPNIMILFLGIALLETTGYMSRVAFLLDGILHKFGLHGKSFIPLITGFGCSVPAFMATRTLKNKRDRLLTLFVINFMSCGARLLVYVLFIGAFFQVKKQEIIFLEFILGAILGLFAAKFLRMTAFRGLDEPFVMEMPKYRMPNWHLVWFMVYNKAKMYLKKAGTFILLASLLIWFASNFPKSEENLNDFNAQERAIEQSYLGQFGKGIEPIFKPLELDWKLSVSLISGLAARSNDLSYGSTLFTRKRCR
ncbi:ferrous iron transport protein B [Campylobacter jejuni]